SILFQAVRNNESGSDSRQRRAARGGDLAQMIDEKIVEKPLNLVGLNCAQLEAGEGGPIQFFNFSQDLPGAWAQLVIVQFRLLAQLDQQFHLEGEEGQRLRRLRRQMSEQAGQQLKNHGQGRLGLGGLLDQGVAVAGLLQIGDFLAQGRVRLAQDDLAQGVQFRAAAAREAQVGVVK